MFEDLDPTFREWLWAREVMRRLGFSPDEIFFAVSPSGTRRFENGRLESSSKPVIILRIQAQGKEFNWTIGETDIPDEQLESHFERACERWNSSCNSPDLDHAFIASNPVRVSIQLMQTMQAKGFILRKWN